MKFARVLLLVVILPLLTTAQEPMVDTLLAHLPQLKETARIDCLEQLSQGFCWVNTDSARLYAGQAQAESQQLQYQKGLDLSLYLVGSVEMLSGHNSKAEPLLRKALAVLPRYGPYYRGWCLLHLGFTLYNQGKFTEAIDLMEQSVPIMASNGNADDLAKVYTLLSLVYGATGDYEKGLFNAVRSYRERVRTGNTIGMGYSLRMLGRIYYQVGDDETAIAYFKRCLTLNRRSFSPITEYGELAVMYAARGQYDSANKYIRSVVALAPASNYVQMYTAEVDAHEHRFDTSMAKLQRCLKTFQEDNSFRITPRVLLDISRIHFNRLDYVKARRYAREAFNLSEKMGARPTRCAAAGLLATSFAKSGHTDSAYYFLQLFTQLKESLTNDQFKAKLFGFNNSLEDERKQATISLLKKEKVISDQQLKNATLEKTILIAGIVAILVLCFFIFRNTILARKNAQLEAAQLKQHLQVQQMEASARQMELHRKAEKLEMKALRAQMNPHFIFNCLSSINRFILINEREAASDYLTKFSRLIRMALQHSEKTLVTLETELDMLKLYLDLEQLRFRNSFNYTISIAKTIDVSSIYVPPLLLQPFAENAIWHGLMHKKGQGNLGISISINGPLLICNITDDGVGRSFAAMHQSKSAEKTKSMGVQITRERINLFNNKQADDDQGIDIKDILDESGQPSGTNVLLKVHYRNPATVTD